MVKYTVCGATGGTGRAILRCLLANPPQDLELNIFLRNKKKLLGQFPDIESKPLSLNIFEGSNTDRALWKQALNGTDVILMCIATNESKKGNTLFSDTAEAVTGALQELQTEQQHAYKTPAILVLRAITLNEKFNPGTNSPAFLFFALRHLYDAMVDANKIYEAKAKENPGLLDIIYVDPPAIHDEEGTTTTGFRLDTKPYNEDSAAGHNLSYADLGAAYCEIAQRRKEFVGQGVAVTATGEVKTTWGSNMYFLAGGILGRFWG